MGHEDQFPRPRPNGRCPFSYPTSAGASGNGKDAPKAGIKASELVVRADHLLGRVRIGPDDCLCSAGVVVGGDATGARYTLSNAAPICIRPRDRTAAASAPQIG